MPRTKTVVPGRKRRRKVMTAVKGNRGGRRKLYQTARETLMRSLQFAYRDRRAKKREFRKLWIVRSAVFYKRGVEIDRKVLADIAVRDGEAFARLAEVAKQATIAA